MKPLPTIDDPHLICDLARMKTTEELELLRRPSRRHAGIWRWISPRWGNCILKISTAQYPEILERVHHEIRVLQSLNECSATTPILFEINNSGVIHGFGIRLIRENRRIKSHVPESIRGIANSLSDLHCQTWYTPYPPFDFQIEALLKGHAFWIGADSQILAVCEELSGGSYDESSKAVQRVIKLLRRSRTKLTAHFSPDKMVMIHGDGARENLILCTRKRKPFAYLIDFDCAVVGPVQHDLARISVSLNLSTEGERLFLNSYCKAFYEATGYTWEPIMFKKGFDALKILARFDFFIAGPIIKCTGEEHVPMKTAVQKMIQLTEVQIQKELNAL